MTDQARAVPATWTAQDIEDLERLNGSVWVDLFEGAKPWVRLDARGYETWALMQDSLNPIAIAALEGFFAMADRGAITPGSKDFLKQAHEARLQQDTILAAVFEEPRYCPTARLVNGRPPTGMLWWGALTSEQRRRAADFFYAGGTEALKPFRAEQWTHGDAVRDGRGLQPAAEQPVDPAGAGVSAVVARRSSAALEP